MQLIHDSKGWNLINPATVEDSPVAAPQMTSDALAPDTKRAIAAYMAWLKRSCHEVQLG
ncbi:hypothetical protein NDI52_28520 [Leptolyngbya sp. PL-A3]